MTHHWIKLLAGLVLLCPARAATVTFLNSPVSSLDTVSWAQLGVDGTAVAQTFSAVSGNGVMVAGSLAGSSGLTSVVCNPANPVNCSWAPPAAGYAIGDHLIWAEDLNSAGSGPITLSFAAQYGAGIFVQSVSAGQFSAQLQAFSGAGLLGSQSYTSDAAGDPLYLGVTDSTKEITKTVVSITACSAFVCDPNDFSVNSLQFLNAPEPSTLFSGAGALLVWGIWLARKTARANGISDDSII